MNKTLIITVFIFFTISGCATTAPELFIHYNVVDSKPDSYGIRRTTQDGNILDGETFFDSNKVQLNLEMARDSGKICYNILIHWFSPDGKYIRGHHLNIQEGNSLVIVADNVKMTFRTFSKPTYGYSRSVTDQGASDNAVYQATLEQIKMITGANKVSVYILGINYGVMRSNPKNFVVKRIFNAENFINFRKFYNEVIMVQK